ncbi:hypothetical protein EV646_10986 [Kribbella antiqua]|uniref:Uncharacterized protein n=1 Tax=Kribbella antiqua TaxID=2512217 RepID=A0A4R2IJ03_9ACTN|nr:hypothetical protein [Kribbella antiqua]TCO44914.1 hypothetical protein EV646_10986 [Kribbella antiqua]
MARSNDLDAALGRLTDVLATAQRIPPPADDANPASIRRATMTGWVRVLLLSGTTTCGR